jgi:hypothetical protein
MRCCTVFFMGNSLSDPKDLLIPFIVTNTVGGFGLREDCQANGCEQYRRQYEADKELGGHAHQPGIR